MENIMQKQKVTGVLALIAEIIIKLTSYFILAMVALFIGLLLAGYFIEHYMIPDTRGQHTYMTGN